jgi:hypothetical protein
MTRLGVAGMMLALVALLVPDVTAPAGPVGATAKKKERPDVIEVPTAGKIIDVVYHPEFDDWWVTCREGDNIAVYTYDPRTQKWGKVVFVPKKPEETGKKPEKPKEPGEGDEIHKPDYPPKGDEQRTESPKAPTSEGSKGEKKWWDRLNILKGLERPGRPSTPEQPK